jgi:O-antigen ligase
MKQIIANIVRYFIYATFFVPLLVFPTSFIFPFVVPKILVFRSLVELMLGGYVLLLFINWQEFKPKFSWLHMAVLGFFISFSISTFAGVDWYHSFWDNHERMLGLFTIAHYVAYYFVVGAMFKTWDEWKRALRVFLVAGSAVMFVGVLQIFNPNLLLNQGSPRIIATLGNAIYVGGYGMFLVFVSFLLFLKEENKVWKWVSACAGLLAFVSMIFSGTRGSMLGFVIGSAVALVAYILFLRDLPKVRKILMIIAGFGVILVGLLYVFRNSEFVQKIPAVNRVFETSFETVKNSPRWFAWESAVESWKEKPVFGWGPNNFFYAFNKYYQPKSLEFGYGETWFDNAHNILVNTLAVQGVVGVVTYLFMFAVAVILVIIARKKRGLNVHVAVVSIAFLAAHLVQSITVFENPTSYLYFVFWLAMIAFVVKPAVFDEKNMVKNNTTSIGVNKTIGLGGVVTTGVVFMLIVFIFNIQPARANMQTLEALKYLSYQPETGLELMKKALAFSSPHIDDIRSDLARTAAQVVAGGDTKLDKEKKVEIFMVAFEALQSNVALHPYDIRNYLTLSQLSQSGYLLTGDIKYITDYGTYLQTALSYSPRRQQIIYNVANFNLQIGKMDEAVKLIEDTITDDPKVSEGYWRLAYIYQLSGNAKKVKETLELAEKNGIVFNVKEQEIISEILKTNAIK